MTASRPTLLDTLAHAAVLRALDVFAGAPCILLDATAGNGHDTCFLAAALRDHRCAAGGGLVLACDVQEAAVLAATSRLREAGLASLARVALCGHERIVARMPPQLPLAAGMFNLGYLPGSDRRHTTAADTTLAALEQAAARLAGGGVLTLHCYTGHPGGQEEADAVRRFARTLPPRRWRVLECADANRDQRGEIVLLLEKLPERRPRVPEQGSRTAVAPA